MDDGKKKGGIKVHLVTDVQADTAVFAKISEEKMHNKKFLAHLNPLCGKKTQVCSKLIALLMLKVSKVSSKSEKVFSTLSALIRMHLISH